jgi:aspartyl-tRNA(Asn)/glutamyl-tRNA(Gln) amidotransferase subunit B
LTLTTMTRIGIEVHARLQARSKLFSLGGTLVNAMPNGSQVHLLDYGLPGAMPSLNWFCVQQAIRAGLALNGDVQAVSMFDRKHYTYCDQPLGYQITQQTHPIVLGGQVKLQSRTVRLSRIQLEQDTAKSMHAADCSLIDFNRAGVGLVEIVSLPEMTSALEAVEYVKTIQTLLRHVGVCDGRMEDGSLRADINVSVGKSHRVEIKNLNSLRSVERAVACEEARLSSPEMMRDNNHPNETRGFDALTGRTHALRDKDTELDYRFMPEPDLPPLVLTVQDIEQVRASLSELPHVTKARLLNELHVDEQYCDMLIARPELMRVFEQCLVAETRLRASVVSAWICNVLVGHNSNNLNEIRVADLTHVCFEVQEKRMPASVAKDLLIEYVAFGKPLPAAVNSDEDTIARSCELVIREHPNELVRYKQGKKQLVNFFTGKAVQELKRLGVASDAGKVREIMLRRLSGDD